MFVNLINLAALIKNGGPARDEITFDCSIGAGPVHRDPLDSQPADRLEEAYR
jgi:hypothetical protein